MPPMRGPRGPRGPKGPRQRRDDPAGDGSGWGGPRWMREGGPGGGGGGPRGARAEGEERRDNVMSVRVTNEALLAIDMLVHGGVARSRSEAAALLIEAGVRSNHTLFQKISTLREELSELHILAAELTRGERPAGDAPPAAAGSPGADTAESSGDDPAGATPEA